MNISQLLQDRYGKPHLSYSSIKQALDDIARFDSYMKNEIVYRSDALDFGTMYDMLLFEREKAMKTYVILDNEAVLERCSSKTQEMKSPTATNEYKEVKAAMANEYASKGKVICNPDDWKKANEMIERLDSCKIIESYFSGDYQVPIYQDIDGVLIKGFIDCLSSNMVVDSKSTRSVDGFRYDVNKLSYDIQAYLYTKATGIKSFYWVAQEKEYPYLPAVVKCSEETLFKGEMKFKSALSRIKQFVTKDTDPKSDFLYYEV